MKAPGVWRLVAGSAVPYKTVRLHGAIGRDGVKKDDLAAIGPERRNGYAWYGEWGRRVLTRYARWEAARSR